MDGITDSMDMSLSKLREMMKDRETSVLQSMGSQSQTQLSDFTFFFFNQQKCHLTVLQLLRGSVGTVASALKLPTTPACGWTLHS